MSTWNWGNLILGKEIGNGVSSTVYIGHYEGSPVAIKLLKADISFDQQCVEEWSQLKHCNIVKLLHHGTPNTGPLKEKKVLITEYCSEGSLSHLLTSHPKGLPENLFLTLLLSLRDGLSYLKQKTLIHRDIMPTKICLHKDNKGHLRFKINGFANVQVEPLSGETWSPEDYVTGNCMFWHPFVHAKDEGNESSTVSDKKYLDLWSTAVLLFLAATGEYPFQPHDSVPGDPRSKLKDAFNFKNPGVLQMIQHPEGDWESVYGLPKSMKMSRDLKDMLRPLLAGLLEVNKKRMWTFEEFKNHCDIMLGRLSAIRVAQPE